jgi:FKBP12-rapamycin complex-associated protein
MEKSAAIQLALETLGTFNLQEKLLIDFVREVVVSFLDDDSPYVAPSHAAQINHVSDPELSRALVHSAIRKAAALTCSSLLVRANKNSPTRGQVSVVIGEVLEKLLIVGIADPGTPFLPLISCSCVPSRLALALIAPDEIRSVDPRDGPVAAGLAVRPPPGPGREPAFALHRAQRRGV